MAEHVSDAGRLLTVKVIGGPDETVIRVGGELDLSSVDVLDEALSNVLSKDDVDVLVFDLEELSFMDSSGIAALLRVVARGVGVLLRKPSRLVREIIATTHLDATLKIEGEP